MSYMNQKSRKRRTCRRFMRFMKQRDNLCGRTEIMHSGEQGDRPEELLVMIFLREICMYWRCGRR